MAHYRKLLRDETGAAIAAHARFAGFKHLRAFAKGLAAGDLPAFGVTIPTEDAQPVSIDGLDRQVVLAVGLKRTGGEDIEDVLDLDAATIETEVVGLLEGWPESATVLGVRTEVEIDHDGGKRVGTLYLQFRLLLLGTLGAPAT